MFWIIILYHEITNNVFWIIILYHEIANNICLDYYTLSWNNK